MRRGARAFALLAAGVLAACGGRSGPDLPDGEEPKREIILRTEYDDRRAGEEAAEEVQSALGVLQDEALTAYVSEVGRRMLRYAPRRHFEYAFGIVEQDAPNAFALPGGFVYVSTGLLALTNSEDELANVLAHEIAHAAARHAAARQQVMNTLPAPLRWLQWLGNARYSRAQEVEADRLGQGLAALAGYDPAGLTRFLRSLEFSERLRRGASRRAGFLDTHPTTASRVAEAGRRAEMIRWEPRPPLAGDRAAYLARLEGLVVGESGREGSFRGSRFLHADLDFTLRFPDGWETHNTPSAVGAVGPKRDRVIYLEHQGEGSDPEQAANEFLESEDNPGLRVDRMQPVRIGAFPALWLTATAGPLGRGLDALVTFIAREGHVYRVVGLGPLGSGERFDALYLNTTRSFRPLTPEQRASIRETRLRIAEARDGESLWQLTQRTENAWNAQETAVANAVFVDEPLRAGQRVKIAVAERYRPAADDVRPTGSATPPDRPGAGG